MGSYAAEQPPSAKHSQAPVLGSKVGGRYQLDRLLARGATGLVYAASDIRLGRDAVVKVLPPWAFREATRQRFLREARATAAIDHPNVVHCWDAGFIQEGLPYIAMERLRGVTLAERLGRVGLLPVREAIETLRDVLAALSSAHAVGVLHRDIKPANVFLARRGAVVFDFGLSLDPSVADRLTGKGVVLGTPGYMAPEQITGRRIDARTDLYCASATAYEMLTGQLPIAPIEKSVHRLFEAVQHEIPTPPSRVRPWIRGDIDELLLRGLAKEPGDRFADADEMSARCDAIIAAL